MTAPPERPPDGPGRALLALGSNLPPRQGWLEVGRAALVEAGCRVLGSSPSWHTAAIGAPAQPDFLNQLLLLEAELRGLEWLELARTVERRAGRLRSLPHGPRTLDVDLELIEGESWAGPELSVPHPALLRRPYLLRGAAELVPGWIHPGPGRSMAELASELLRGSWAL